MPSSTHNFWMLDRRMHLKCCSPGNTSRHMQATCVHTQACAHMQAHVLTCVNCKRTARRKTHVRFCVFTAHVHNARTTITATYSCSMTSSSQAYQARAPLAGPTPAAMHCAIWRCSCSSRLWSSLPRTAQERYSLDQLHSAARHCFAFQRQSSRESVRQTTTAAVLGHTVRRRQHWRRSNKIAH